jgi:hypothetical protein
MTPDPTTTAAGRARGHRSSADRRTVDHRAVDRRAAADDRA